MPEPANATEFGPVISVYTRAQAIADGILVDVSETAREAGFKIPVALTRTVWERIVALPEGYRGFQDERGRLWDVLSMARHYALRASTQRPRHHVRARPGHPQGPPRQPTRASPQALPHRGDRWRRPGRARHHRDVPRGRLSNALPGLSLPDTPASREQ